MKQTQKTFHKLYIELYWIKTKCCMFWKFSISENVKCIFKGSWFIRSLESSVFAEQRNVCAEVFSHIHIEWEVKGFYTMEEKGEFSPRTPQTWTQTNGIPKRPCCAGIHFITVEDYHLFISSVNAILERWQLVIATAQSERSTLKWLREIDENISVMEYFHVK